ncbi:MAG: hypothetical protein KF723_22125 [Rhizobiaceae bacterium]|nr:hypothetical protein [Rhizobiaceae bacterium]
MIEEPIVLVGAPRSGTSLVTMCLAACGAWVGKCRNPDHRTPRGYYENWAISELLKLGVPLRRSAVEKVLLYEGYKGGPWLMKHSAKPWQLWLPEFTPRWVLIHRPRNEIVASRMRANGESEAEAIEQAKINADALLDIAHKVKGFETIEARPIVQGDFSGIKRLCERFGLAFDEAAVAAMVEPALWAGVGGLKDGRAPVPD